MDELEPLIKEITDELSALRQEVANLPETLELPDNSPLRYMLTPESERLDRMLNRCMKMSDKKEIQGLIAEYTRLGEMLTSHREIHHDIDPDGHVMQGLTAKLDTLQSHFMKLCEKLNP